MARSRSRSRSREKNRDKEKEKNRHREKEKDRERDREKDRDRNRNRDRERHRSRDKSRSREKSRERDRSAREKEKEEKRKKRKTGWDIVGDDTNAVASLNATSSGSNLVNPLALQQQSNIILQNLQNKAVDKILCRIYVGSLDYYLTEHEIKSVFQAFGTITSVDMPKEGDRSKGFCFVEYASPEAAEMALNTMQGFVLKGRTIKVGRPTAVGSGLTGLSPLNPLASSTTTQTGAGNISAMMGSVQAGAAAATAILAGRAGTPTDSGSVTPTIQTPGMANLSPQSIATSPLGQSNIPNNRVYVGNVPFGFTSDDLKKIFIVFGPILSCQLLPSVDNPTQHRGYGFLEYATAQAAKLAIDTMNGFELAGKQLKVNFATAVRTPGTPGVPTLEQLTNNLVQSPLGNMNNISGLGVGLKGNGVSPFSATTGTNQIPTTDISRLVNGSSTVQIGDSAGSGGVYEHGHHTNAGINNPAGDNSTICDSNSINTEVILLTNMIQPEGVDEDLNAEIREECSKYGEIRDVQIYPVTNDVRIFVQFTSVDGARHALPALHGRWFGGRPIHARPYPLENFVKRQFDL